MVKIEDGLWHGSSHINLLNSRVSLLSYWATEQKKVCGLTYWHMASSYSTLCSVGSQRIRKHRRIEENLVPSLSSFLIRSCSSPGTWPRMGRVLDRAGQNTKQLECQNQIDQVLVGYVDTLEVLLHVSYFCLRQIFICWRARLACFDSVPRISIHVVAHDHKPLRMDKSKMIQNNPKQLWNRSSLSAYKNWFFAKIIAHAFWHANIPLGAAVTGYNEQV